MKFNEIVFGTKNEYSSFRYIQEDNALGAVLPRYFTSDIFIYRKIEFNNFFLTFRLECKNIFDERYEIISNYIMPGRQFRASINYKL
jgi:outer membrane receptor protein involved in Fe transport